MYELETTLFNLTERPTIQDAATLLREHEALFVRSVKEVVIQGGVEPFVAGVAADGAHLNPDLPYLATAEIPSPYMAGAYLKPDTAHNNEFDAAASALVYEGCQRLGVPLLIVSRFAAGGCQVPRSIYDDMAATGSPIGRHLKQTQRGSIERLWKQACAALALNQP